MLAVLKAGVGNTASRWGAPVLLTGRQETVEKCT